MYIYIYTYHMYIFILYAYIYIYKVFSNIYIYIYVHTYLCTARSGGWQFASSWSGSGGPRRASANQCQPCLQSAHRRDACSGADLSLSASCNPISAMKNVLFCLQCPQIKPSVRGFFKAYGSFYKVGGSHFGSLCEGSDCLASTFGAPNFRKLPYSHF